VAAFALSKGGLVLGSQVEEDLAEPVKVLLVEFRDLVQADMISQFKLLPITRLNE
jgi:hypothetical protein